MLLIILMGWLLSCEVIQPNDHTNPSNLSLTVLVSEENPGQVDVQAEAENAIEYRFYADNSDTPEETNPSGIYTYSFSTFGSHQIEVRAYGVSGKYVKEVREVVVTGGKEISREDGFVSPWVYDGYELLWNDEFDGTRLKDQYWTYDLGDGCPNCGWGNNELQYYRKNNATVSDDLLIIEARKESYQNKNYTSARVKTQGLKTFKYGRIDIRALLPEGQGIWPALWMLGANITSVGWPSCGEIDIMEMIGGNGREKTVHGTLHWAGNGGEHLQAGSGKSLSSGTYADEYHVFSIIWNEFSIKWLINNQQYHVISITPADLSEFHQNFFLIFNLAVGGNWPGNPDSTTKFPQQLKVDYVRVFKETQ